MASRPASAAGEEAMLNVGPICGNAMDNLYVMLQQVDWGLGDPHGLAHWNGRDWRWVRRLENRCVVDMQYGPRGVYVLDIDGSISILDLGENWDTIDPPVLAESRGGRYGQIISMSRFAFLGNGQIGAVGINGTFFIHEFDTWRMIETDCRVELKCISGLVPNCYIGGNDGVILRYDGKRCRLLHSCEGDFIGDIANGSAEDWFLSYVRRDQQGGLYRVLGDGIRRIPANVNVGSVGAISSTEVYCAASWQGLYLWNGLDFRKVHSQTLSGGVKVEGRILFGTGPRPEGGDAIYYGPPFGPKIAVDLDPSFLDVPRD